MPFKSKAQQRYMFSQHPELAKEFAEHTDFSKLPERVKKPKKKHEKLAEMIKRIATEAPRNGESSLPQTGVQAKPLEMKLGPKFLRDHVKSAERNNLDLPPEDSYNTFAFGDRQVPVGMQAGAAMGDDSLLSSLGHTMPPPVGGVMLHHSGRELEQSKTSQVAFSPFQNGVNQEMVSLAQKLKANNLQKNLSGNGLKDYYHAQDLSAMPQYSPARMKVSAFAHGASDAGSVYGVKLSFNFAGAMQTAGKAMGALPTGLGNLGGAALGAIGGGLSGVMGAAPGQGLKQGLIGAASGALSGLPGGAGMIAPTLAQAGLNKAFG